MEKNNSNMQNFLKKGVLEVGNERCSLNFEKKITQMIADKKAGKIDGMLELLDINPNELTMEDEAMWNKLMNYSFQKIYNHEIEKYRNSVKKSHNQSRLNFSALIYNKLTPIKLNE